MIEIKQIENKDNYTISGLEEVDLMNLKEALRLSTKRYQADIERHKILCQENMCKMYSDGGRPGRTCTEDLMFLHDQLARLTGMIFAIETEGL